MRYIAPQQDIDGADMKPGKVYIVIDMHRVGPEAFLVVVQGDGSLAGGTVQRGIFWKREDAEVFKAALTPVPANA